MTLKANLGCLPPPPSWHCEYGQGSYPPVHRPPAYFRRHRREATNDKEKKDTNIDDSTKQFECLLCDFHSNWENALKVHMSRMHTRIDQLDGHTDN